MTGTVPLATDLPMTETSIVVLALSLGITIAWLLLFFR